MTMFMLGFCFDSCVCRAQPRSIHCFEIDVEPADRQQQQLFMQIAGLDARRHHRAENHVAACSGETIELESLPHPNSGSTSPALPVSTSAHRLESGVRSGFTSTTYAPA